MALETRAMNARLITTRLHITARLTNTTVRYRLMHMQRPVVLTEGR